MQKRLCELALTICLAVCCAAPAFAAAGFDSSMLKNAQDIVYMEFGSGGETETAYYVGSLHEAERWYYTPDESGALLIYPCVYETAEGEVFTLCFSYDARAGMDIRYALFDIGGTYYTFSGLESDTELEIEGLGSQWWISSQACITLDAASLSMLDAMVEHRDEEIYVVAAGDDSIVQVTLGQPEIDGIIHLYNLYKLAGGEREANLQKMPAGSGTQLTVQSE